MLSIQTVFFWKKSNRAIKTDQPISFANFEGQIIKKKTQKEST